MKDKILGYASMWTDKNKKVNKSEIFDKNKRYGYDKESLLKDDWKKELYESGYNKNLTDEGDGKEVDIIDEYNARVIIFGKPYIIERSSCKEIEQCIMFKNNY